MLKNYLIIAYRNLLGKKFFSFINIMGLAVGIAGFLMIAQYVVFEFSYDRFHQKSDQIFRVQLNQFQNGELMLASAENYPGVGPALKSDLPEVVEYTRLYNMGYKNNIVITYDDAPNGPVKFKQNKFMYADSAFFEIFSFPLTKGNPQTVLDEPYSAVISETYARKYFGDVDPIGKMLHLKDDDFNDELCKVTGVFKDIPDNSHIKFDILFSYSTLYNRFEGANERYNLTWGRKDFYTYILVRKGTSPKQLETKLPALVDKYSPDLAKYQRKDELMLQPLTDIHLHSSLSEEAETNGNAKVVYALLIIGGFILVIAWINYVNLSTVRATERSREVGVRKALGAFSGQITKQFLTESFLINIFAILIGCVIVCLVLPLFNQLTGLEVTISNIWNKPWMWALLGVLLVLSTLLSGLYPALMLASFRPAKVLKGKLQTSSHGVFLRKTLVIFQFVAAMVLVTGTAIVYQQMQFLLNQDLGLNIEQTLVMERPSIRPESREAQISSFVGFKNKLLEKPGIKKVAGVDFIPGYSRNIKFNFRKYGAPEEDAQPLRVNAVDFDFFDLFEMELLAGRTFSPEFVNDFDTAVVITESAVKRLGFESPADAAGQTVMASFGSDVQAFIIVGVVNDYHQVSLKAPMEPMVILLSSYMSEFYTLKVSTDNLSETIAYVESAWDEFYPGNPFSYFFLDEYFNRQYQMDRRFNKLITVFAVLAVFIAGLGLFGLSAFTAQQRTKEIGIRKVLGASVASLILLLSKDFTKLMLLALAFAVPITIFAMDEWLNTYALRIEIGPGIFILTGLSLLLIAWLTLSFQSIKAALANPVDSLKND